MSPGCGMWRLNIEVSSIQIHVRHAHLLITTELLRNDTVGAILIGALATPLSSYFNTELHDKVLDWTQRFIDFK